MNIDEKKFEALLEDSMNKKGIMVLVNKCEIKETVFKVRIISCSDVLYWYKNNLGFSFDVKEVKNRPKKYQVLNKTGSIHFIDIKDCVII